MKELVYLIFIGMPLIIYIAIILLGTLKETDHDTRHKKGKMNEKNNRR